MTMKSKQKRQRYVIVRTYSMGVFAGTLDPASTVLTELERDWGYAFNKQTTYRLVRVRVTEVIKQRKVK